MIFYKRKVRNCVTSGPIVAGCSKCGATRFVGPWIYEKGRPPFLCERCAPKVAGS